MHTGEKVTLCDCKGYDYICTIISINDQYVEVNINDIVISKSEPNIKVILYQGLPKGDKMDTIIQKAVELGISEIVPVLTNRCVSRPDEKSANKKCQRWQKISLEAAKQSGRGIIPHINNIITFKEMIKRINCKDQTRIFYEQGGQSLSNILNSSRNNINIIIGPEGGFEKMCIRDRHMRPQTSQLLNGLEILSSQEIKHGDIILKEFDLDTAIARKPKLDVYKRQPFY